MDLARQGPGRGQEPEWLERRADRRARRRRGDLRQPGDRPLGEGQPSPSDKTGRLGDDRLALAGWVAGGEDDWRAGLGREGDVAAADLLRPRVGLVQLAAGEHLTQDDAHLELGEG